ncbi:unnamed protein product [Ceutorhynchus assimilis]|uniref:Tetratricopeptide SHNi-TPR domain-containing protein n=1 Tax=Ceutorhynchus assimilis TaxID=467358 RepID=A0A9N9QKB3_9CUCU|nr:unnamed protein product [Ceutorhynchus assimilis]
MTTEEVKNPECEDAQELFGIGVRAFVLQDYNQAAEVLSRALELLVQEHQDNLHESLGKVYLVYGKALLGCSKTTIQPLGEKIKEKAKENGEATSGDEDEEANENGEAHNSEPEADDNDESVEPGPVENPEEDEDDLEVAWEVLECAKKIFEKQNDKKQLAETLIALGEVSLESGNNESAIEDIKQGLELQKELLPNDSRAVAETLYKLGMAYCIESNMDEAIKNFQAAQQYLNNRIKTLEETEVQTDDIREEIEEIRQLMPNIDEKIEEMQVYKNEREKIENEIIKTITEMSQREVGNSSTAAGSSSDMAGPSTSSESRPVSNISHLVKRKRKSDEMDKDNK